MRPARFFPFFLFFPRYRSWLVLGQATAGFNLSVKFTSPPPPLPPSSLTSDGASGSHSAHHSKASDFLFFFFPFLCPFGLGLRSKRKSSISRRDKRDEPAKFSLLPLPLYLSASSTVGCRYDDGNGRVLARGSAPSFSFFFFFFLPSSTFPFHLLRAGTARRVRPRSGSIWL